MPETEKRETHRSRGFWSGAISFGLVNVPVSLFVANRSGRVSLRMVDRDGTPLSRRYFCSREERLLEDDEIVRGYAVEKDRYVVIDDDELEAIAPEKSREIDLQRFVALSDLDPAWFERAYFLVPGKSGLKPYRLLASAMSDAGRAGIATFVMRGKEYLVAIIADQGLLRAEILRFHDELRTPEDIGLPNVGDVDSKRVRAVGQAMRGLHADKLDKDWLTDRHAQRMQKRVQEKLKAGEDVFEAPQEAESSEQVSAEIIDLMQVLKERLEGKGAASGKRARAAAKSAGRKPAKSTDLGNRSKAELYERAQSLDIKGRSRMSKRELIEALRDAG